MIPWKNPETEVPDPDQLVWVVLQHWKKKGPPSCEIVCGTVSMVHAPRFTSLVVQNNDESGRGWRQYLLKHISGEERDRPKWDQVIAWCLDSELKLPNWLVHKNE